MRLSTLSIFCALLFLAVAPWPGAARRHRLVRQQGGGRLPGTGTPQPTADQARYQQDEIVALTHFNMVWNSS